MSSRILARSPHRGIARSGSLFPLFRKVWRGRWEQAARQEVGRMSDLDVVCVHERPLLGGLVGVGLRSCGRRGCACRATSARRARWKRRSPGHGRTRGWTTSRTPARSPGTSAARPRWVPCAGRPRATRRLLLQPAAPTPAWAAPVARRARLWRVRAPARFADDGPVAVFGCRLGRRGASRPSAGRRGGPARAA